MAPDKKVTIDELILDQMINRCYAINECIKVVDSGTNWIQLHYGKFTYTTLFGIKQRTVKLGEAKEILISKIFKTHKFWYNDAYYYVSDGEWYTTDYKNDGN
ncbi:hypothetical protein [Aquimarina brevivitae]|uniref:Uncharacterized protein n=1 Tax=Aquimarina brevivitae TaxID=323412 RepID=A0A4Q7PHW6_9FLAO|nr:hypothetical protein [Aquimarina brevivitae]RZT00192.1 hypothetical protein EV197_1427 [Aquimarina brevivitae]